MTDEEIKQSGIALDFIKKNKKLLIEKFASKNIYTSDPNPISLFMAGSPGAGKTEISKRLIEKFSNIPIRIDADEIREVIPGYEGANSYIFQTAANKGVNILYDYVLSNDFNVILDGTFAYGGAIENIQRSLNHNRDVEIYYIYQEPEIAWEYTKKREKIEHRRVSRNVFITSFFKARENVTMIKDSFGTKIELNLIVKNFMTGLEEINLNINSVDDYVPLKYNTVDLDKLLK
ncbi:MAG: zeta toxin family protein [bacterium]|nr:zeta toxin family protein [bacterium]